VFRVSCFVFRVSGFGFRVQNAGPTTACDETPPGPGYESGYGYCRLPYSTAHRRALRTTRARFGVEGAPPPLRRATFQQCCRDLRSQPLLSLFGSSWSRHYLRILVYLVIDDSEQVSLEHLLLSRYPSQRLLNTLRRSWTLICTGGPAR